MSNSPSRPPRGCFRTRWGSWWGLRNKKYFILPSNALKSASQRWRDLLIKFLGNLVSSESEPYYQPPLKPIRANPPPYGCCATGVGKLAVLPVPSAAPSGAAIKRVRAASRACFLALRRAEGVRRDACDACYRKGCV